MTSNNELLLNLKTENNITSKQLANALNISRTALISVENNPINENNFNMIKTVIEGLIRHHEKDSDLYIPDELILTSEMKYYIIRRIQGQRLKYYREKSNYSIESMANKMGIKAVTYGNLENGRNHFLPKIIETITEILSVDKRIFLIEQIQEEQRKLMRG